MWLWDLRWPALIHPHAIDTPPPKPPEVVEAGFDYAPRWVDVRWSRFSGQFGGFGKLGSDVCYAAMSMPSQAVWTSSGVLPPRAEWALVRL